MGNKSKIKETNVLIAKELSKYVLRGQIGVG